MDLYNNLNGKDIQLAAFLFGTRELKDLKTEFKRRGNDQIVGRFMINEVQFWGIQDLSEMHFCLIFLDKIYMRDSLNTEVSDSLFVSEHYSTLGKVIWAHLNLYLVSR